MPDKDPLAAQPPPNIGAATTASAMILSHDGQQWLKEFVSESRQKGVQDGSLAYLTEFVRELRTRLGLPADVAAAKLVDAVLAEIDAKQDRPAR